MMPRLLLLPLFAAALVLSATPAHAQRNASFVNPASAPSAKAGDKNTNQPQTLVAEPATVDAGETLVNIARHATVFFSNNFRSPITVNSLTVNADGHVRTRIVSDDCKDIKQLPVNDRCAIGIEVTPASPGPWTVELLVNHSGQGRIARAEIIGTTLGKADEKSEGLAISKKIAPPLDFGELKATKEASVRTMLIENDSNQELVIDKIDLISATADGLSLREKGCKEDDHLKPGESCPISVIWEPVTGGNLATDLIVRHNGNLGFVIVPIRGKSALPEGAKETDVASRGKSGREGASTGSVPTATSADMAVAQALPPLQAGSLLPGRATAPPPAPANVSSDGKTSTASAPEKASATAAPVAAAQLSLIGTVGGRAILGGASGETMMIGLGETISLDGLEVALLQLEPNRAVVTLNGTRRELGLRNQNSYMLRNSATSSTGGTVSGDSSSPSMPELKDDKKQDSTTGAPKSSVGPPPLTPTQRAQGVVQGMGAAGLSPQQLMSVIN